VQATQWLERASSCLAAGNEHLIPEASVTFVLDRDN
jgi:hypothetical protein